MNCIVPTLVITFWSVAMIQIPAAADSLSRHPFGRTLVFAHRGASGERPEHTLAAYRLAMEQGADFIEPDLRITQDGLFVAIHDETLERTTNVAEHPEFADRAVVNEKGRPTWRVGDFTLAELQTLRTRQGRPGRPHDFDGGETIPTLTQVVELVAAYNREQGTRIGITPEMKEESAAFLAWLVDEGQQLGVGTPALPLHVQSFDLDTAVAVRAALDAPCVWLVKDRPSAAQLDSLVGTIDGISIAKAALLEDSPADFVRSVHDRGLAVISWTFADDAFDQKRFASAQAELAAALAAGVDAFFTDHPASGVTERDRCAAADTTGSIR